jgi:hypothetical protein
LQNFPEDPNSPLRVPSSFLLHPFFILFSASTHISHLPSHKIFNMVYFDMVVYSWHSPNPLSFQDPSPTCGSLNFRNILIQLERMRDSSNREIWTHRIFDPEAMPDRFTCLVVFSHQTRLVHLKKKMASHVTNPCPNHSAFVDLEPAYCHIHTGGFKKKQTSLAVRDEPTTRIVQRSGLLFSHWGSMLK